MTRPGSFSAMFISFFAGLAAVNASAREWHADWRYTTDKPTEGWTGENFDDREWPRGKPGFGSGNVHGSPIGTAWTTPDIWLRGTVDLPNPLPEKLALWMHHDEDVELFINGIPAARAEGFTRKPEYVALSPKASEALRAGTNLVAVHCRQTRGGQYINAWFSDRDKPPTETERNQVAYLDTPWSRDAQGKTPWPEYPRPQMTRPRWLNLNGMWNYALKGESAPWQKGRIENALADPLLKPVRKPSAWDGKIRVPFAIESPLSGVQKLVRPNQILWYRRAFEIPDDWNAERILLNFEAADWHAVTWINGTKIGENKGGYVPFTLDITEALNETGPQEITVAVWDPTNMGDQSVGKQALPENKRGFRYTPTTGIWQTVWLEPVPDTYIEDVKITPDSAADTFVVDARVVNADDRDILTVRVKAGNKTVATASGPVKGKLDVPVPDPSLWSPEIPFLYDLEIGVERNGNAVDQVDCYAGMRNIETERDAEGTVRIALNGDPIFQFGPLDQGYWPDGTLTPPSDDAARYDVQYLKDIGCNMVRVHIKVHPRRWYYHCDRLGLLVWQDMVCTRKFDKKITSASSAQWEQEQQRMLDHLHNDPSVVMWIVFNEGWGQYDTRRLTEWTKKYDPSRLVSNASGWSDLGAGDIYDLHDYSFQISPSATGDVAPRAVVCGECGGFNVHVDGHVWYPNRRGKTKIDPLGDVGRENYADAQQWAARYSLWLNSLRMLYADGMNAAVYTQISDVEHELNGWLTYDRKVSKIGVKHLHTMHTKLYDKPNIMHLPTQSGQVESKWTASAQQNGWIKRDFDDSGWTLLKHPSNQSMPGIDHHGKPVFVRTGFKLSSIPRGRPALRLSGMGRFIVNINGNRVRTLDSRDRAGYAPVTYVLLNDKDKALLLENDLNVIAVRHIPKKRPRGHESVPTGTIPLSIDLLVLNE